MRAREKVGGWESQFYHHKNEKAKPPFMDPSPSLIYYFEVLGSNRDHLQSKEKFQNYQNQTNFDIFQSFDVFWPLQDILAGFSYEKSQVGQK